MKGTKHAYTFEIYFFPPVNQALINVCQKPMNKIKSKFLLLKKKERKKRKYATEKLGGKFLLEGVNFWIWRETQDFNWKY